MIETPSEARPAQWGNSRLDDHHDGSPNLGCCLEGSIVRMHCRIVALKSYNRAVVRGNRTAYAYDEKVAIYLGF